MSWCITMEKGYALFFLDNFLRPIFMVPGSFKHADMPSRAITQKQGRVLEPAGDVEENLGRGALTARA